METSETVKECLSCRPPIANPVSRAAEENLPNFEAVTLTLSGAREQWFLLPLQISLRTKKLQIVLQGRRLEGVANAQAVFYWRYLISFNTPGLLWQLEEALCTSTHFICTFLFLQTEVGWYSGATGFYLQLVLCFKNFNRWSMLKGVTPAVWLF